MEVPEPHIKETYEDKTVFDDAASIIIHNMKRQSSTSSLCATDGPFVCVSVCVLGAGLGFFGMVVCAWLGVGVGGFRMVVCAWLGVRMGGFGMMVCAWLGVGVVVFEMVCAWLGVRVGGFGMMVCAWLGWWCSRWWCVLGWGFGWGGSG